MAAYWHFVSDNAVSLATLSPNPAYVDCHKASAAIVALFQCGSGRIRRDGCSGPAGRLPCSASQRQMLIAGLLRRSFALISKPALIINIEIIVFAMTMNRRLAASPARPLIARFGPPNWRKKLPVRPRPAAACKCLIYIALPRNTGSNLGAKSMIRPVFPLLQGGR